MAGNAQDPASPSRVSPAPTAATQSGTTRGSAETGTAAQATPTPAKALAAAPQQITTHSGSAITVGPKAAKPVVNAALKRRPRQPVPGRGATLVSTLAIVVALASALVALYSLNVARQAKSSAASAASDAHRLANPPRTQPPPALAPPARASATPTPGPTATFQHELRAVDLTIPATVGCQSLFVDADTGQVGDYSGHELYLSSCVGPLSVHFDNVDGAVATGGDTTPEACMALLVGTTVNGEIQFPVSPGMTYCLLTQKAAAARAGVPQRLAILRIRTVAPDRTVTATLDTYRLPG